VTFSPASAERRNRSVSRERAKGSSKDAAFQLETITGDDAPMPRTNRPGASSATVAACIASRPGPRVYTGTIAVPSLSCGAHCEASTNGVNASVPAVSAVHASV
jgi:hypothetical protein